MIEHVLDNNGFDINHCSSPGVSALNNDIIYER